MSKETDRAIRRAQELEATGVASEDSDSDVLRSTGTMAIALLTACAASLAAISLTAVSAWLIVEASYGPPIMTLLVAIVGVRFFGSVVEQYFNASKP